VDRRIVGDSERAQNQVRTSDKLWRFIDKLNHHVDTQDVQIDQLANMVNDLVGKVEGQQKEIKTIKADQERHRKVFNTLMAKVIALEVLSRAWYILYHHRTSYSYLTLGKR
jgi:hypothetical protein